jgi:hypothetical protein
VKPEAPLGNPITKPLAPVLFLRRERKESLKQPPQSQTRSDVEASSPKDESFFKSELGIGIEERAKRK